MTRKKNDQGGCRAGYLVGNSLLTNCISRGDLEHSTKNVHPALNDFVGHLLSRVDASCVSRKEIKEVRRCGLDRSAVDQATARLFDSLLAGGRDALDASRGGVGGRVPRNDSAPTYGKDLDFTPRRSLNLFPLCTHIDALSTGAEAQMRSMRPAPGCAFLVPGGAK